jgi:toxin ParE1/3/4
MARQSEIVYLPAAGQDLLDILDYIRQDNPAAALKFIDAIDAAIAKLADFPLMGPIPNDPRLQGLGYRVLVSGDYLIFYVVKAETVQVRRVVHGKRRYGFLL